MGKISASKLINLLFQSYSSLGFQASLPPDNLTLNPTNKRIVKGFMINAPLVPRVINSSCSID